jgi:hypothetical protein
MQFELIAHLHHELRGADLRLKIVESSVALFDELNLLTNTHPPSKRTTNE